MSDGRRLLHDAGLAALEQRLPPGFIRTHRSHIVNAAMVVGMHATDAGPVARLTHNETARSAVAALPRSNAAFWP